MLSGRELQLHYLRTIFYEALAAFASCAGPLSSNDARLGGWPRSFALNLLLKVQNAIALLQMPYILAGSIAQ